MFDYICKNSIRKLAKTFKIVGMIAYDLCWQFHNVPAIVSSKSDNGYVLCSGFAISVVCLVISLLGEPKHVGAADNAFATTREKIVHMLTAMA